MSLEERFHQRCLNLADAVSAATGSYPGYLALGLERNGAVAAVKGLVDRGPSKRFRELSLKQRLDLTVEAVIQEPQWFSLFDEETRHKARDRLVDAGWK